MREVVFSWLNPIECRFAGFRCRTVWKFRSGVAWWILCMDVFVSRRSHELAASRTSFVHGCGDRDLLMTEADLQRPVTVMPMIDIQYPMLPRLPALLCKFLWILVVFWCQIFRNILLRQHLRGHDVPGSVHNHLIILLRKCVIKCRLMEVSMHKAIFIANQHWFW